MLFGRIYNKETVYKLSFLIGSENKRQQLFLQPSFPGQILDGTALLNFVHHASYNLRIRPCQSRRRRKVLLLLLLTYHIYFLGVGFFVAD